MKNIDLERMKKLKNDGLSYSKISKELNIPIGTIKTYFSRNKETNIPETITCDKNHCLECGKAIKSMPHHRERKFCSDECRLNWWSKNRDKLNLKTLIKCTCVICKKEFLAPRHTKRKYCGRDCFNKSKVGVNNG